MILVSNRDLPFGFIGDDNVRLNIDGPLELNSYEFKSSWDWLNPDKNSDRDRNPYRLLIVHGFNTSIRDAIVNGIRIESLYDTGCVSFSWPSKLARWFSLPNVYPMSKYDARASVPALSRLIWMMANSQKNGKLILAAHSMGNLILRHIVEEIPLEKIERIVMIAADLPQDSHYDVFAELSRKTDVHIVQNKSDYALKASSLINGHFAPSRLGQVASKKIPEATYHDLSGTVGQSHSYHIDKHASENNNVRALFETLLR